VDIRHLRYFVAVAEESSFTRAAERLWVAQPGLSAQVRRLEEEMGLRLFIRHSRGVVLTQPGVLLLERARAVLDAFDAVQELGRDLEAGRRGTLRLGLCNCATWSGTSPLLGCFGGAHPDVEVTVVQSLGGLLVREVRDRRLDAAIVPAPFATPELSAVPLSGDPLAVGVPPGHPLDTEGPVDAGDLEGHDLLVHGHRDSGAFDRSIEEVLCGLGVSTAARRKSPDPASLAHDRAPDAVVVTTAASCRRSGLVARKLRPTTRMPFAIVHRAGESSAVLGNFLSVAAEAVTEAYAQR
jgi:DNA-binding transcriptional LysR family regulator